jgi:hypothetical protein
MYILIKNQSTFNNLRSLSGPSPNYFLSNHTNFSQTQSGATVRTTSSGAPQWTSNVIHLSPAGYLAAAIIEVVTTPKNDDSLSSASGSVAVLK